MRKVFIALIVFMFIAPTLGNAYSPNYVFDHDPIYVFIDGKEPAFTNEPFFQNGTTLIEFRPVFELLGLQVGWDQRTKKITGKKQGLTIEMTLGSRTALVNGRAVTMSVAPQARSGRTLVPLRFVAEASGKKVEWSSKARMILINDGVYERINTTLTKNDLNRSILDNARRGYLGPFHYSDITGYSTRPLGDVVNKFGMPDERYNGTDASDDRPFIYYGNYAISIIGTSNTHYLKNPRATGLSMYFNERLTPQDVTRALGPPDAKEIGMYDYLDYYVGDYVLSVVYYDNSVYYFELYKR